MLGRGLSRKAREMDDREEKTWTPQHRPGQKPDKEPAADPPKPRQSDKPKE
jgi:hypothetical protein